MTLDVPSLLKRAWRQPQQLWLRKAFFQIHLWSGVLLALYVFAIGISGSILVFKDEFMPRPHVGRIPFDASRCTPQRLIAAMNSAARTHPDKLPSLATCPIEANNLYAITLHPKGSQSQPPTSLTVYVHPETGSIVGEINQQGTFIKTIEDFHLYLLLRHNGMQWNGVGAAILLAMVVSGLGLWWPGVRNWRRGLKVDFKRTWKRINWDLHSAIGIWTLLFTMTWALTGIYFAWPAPFEKAINAASPIGTARYPEEAINGFASQVVSNSKQRLDLEQVLGSAQAISPGGHLEGLFFGTGPRALLTVYIARDHLGDYTKTDFIYYDQHTGEHFLTWPRGDNETLGDWLLWLLVPLHFGTSWGLAGKLVWSALGLMLPMLVATGLLMYWNRWLRKFLMA